MKIKMAIGCLLLLGVAFTAVHILKIPAGNLLSFGVILLCPLMHIFMMKNMHASHDKEMKTHDQEKA